MAYPTRMLIRFIAIISFLAGIVAMLRGGLATVPELLITLLLGILLVAALWQRGDAISYFLLVLFFVAEVADVIYLYTLAGYFSPARLGALAIAIVGVVWASTSMLMEPFPERVRADVRKLLAAEKKISEAKETLKQIKEIVPKEELKPVKHKRSVRRRKKA